MKAKSKLPISHLFVDLIPKELQPNILYICEEYKTASHLCFCGCNELTITPLTGGKFWDLIKEKEVMTFISVGMVVPQKKRH
jgi:hypothetical protein